MPTAKKAKSNSGKADVKNAVCWESVQKTVLYIYRD